MEGITGAGPSVPDIMNTFGLPPPTGDGQNVYNAMIIGPDGRPLGAKEATQEIMQALGWDPNDTMTPAMASEIEGLLSISSNYNVAINILAGQGLNENGIQLQFDIMDPSNPQVPIITVLYNISKDGMGIDSIKVNQDALRDAQNADGATGADGTEGATGVKSSGNAWLAGSAYVVFLICFMEMMEALKNAKIASGQKETFDMAMVFQYGKDLGKAIEDVANKQFMMHVAAACAAGIALAISVVSAAQIASAGAKMADSSFQEPAPPKGASEAEMKQYNAAKEFHENSSGYTKAYQSMQYWQTMGGIAQSMTQFVTNLTQALIDIPVAKLEALKELIQALKTIMQHMMEKASDQFKANTDMIAQLIQLLDSIRQKLQEAIKSLLSKSG